MAHKSHGLSFPIILLVLACKQLSRHDTFVANIGFGSWTKMCHDTTLQEAASRGIKCHGNNMSKSCKLVRLIAKYLR